MAADRVCTDLFYVAYDFLGECVNVHLGLVPVVVNVSDVDFHVAVARDFGWPHRLAELMLITDNLKRLLIAISIVDC